MTAPPYGTPQYDPSYPGSAEPAKGRGLAIASLILGIIGILLGFTFCASWLGAILGLVGIILGIVGLTAAGKTPGGKKGLPLAGITASVVALLLGVTITIVGFMYAVEFAHWGITEGANAEADAWSSDARARGVDEETIIAARARLTEVLENAPTSFQDMERYTQEVERAKQEFRDALEGGDADADDDAPVGADGADTVEDHE